ncbi:DUF3037 domain-containing protein [Terribacillus sp. 7520-G]|uniref:DUF3037 domain-containing protein n=1 Tax=Terribacillus sp. 7520-G TaxID=2025389 RepID=UPI000BA6BE81|nr:DUF3037 domain-containing protein [Terribacillus sp. 7520-G]PAD39833.1 hypothetical protein CHH53_04115 [Terribacillus sp. 7520-G]
MEQNTVNWYSIIRYMSNELTGEVINVGVVMHSPEIGIIKHHLIGENAPKIKAISTSTLDIQLYKSYKDNLSYYIEKSTENMFGGVGGISIASPYKEGYLDDIHDFFKNEKLFLTKPKASITGNLEKFFETVFKTYVGEKYLINASRQISTKRYMRSLLEDKHLLNKKVIQDYIIKPKDGPELVKINIDFCFKNGVMNYLQGLPVIDSASKSTEWFAKTKLMFEQLSEDAEIHFMVKKMENNNQKETSSLIEYFKDKREKVSVINLDNERDVHRIINRIEHEAHDIDEILIS